MKVWQTALGVGFAVVGDQVWRRVGPMMDLLPLEHEHVGLISLIVAQESKRLESLATGFGTSLIVTKATYPDPLNLSEPSELPLNIGLDAVLGGILVMRHFSKRD